MRVLPRGAARHRRRANAHALETRFPGAEPLIIQIASYDPEWPQVFEREAARVRSALGSTALRIEHTGSTSVPGLAAKPVVDMLLVVRDSADEASYLPRLEAAGYVLRIREAEWHEHRMLKGPDADINLHVLSSGSREADRILAFRDWLRNHADDRDRYERAKQQLASQSWNSVDDYARAKSAIIEDILSRALELNL